MGKSGASATRDASQEREQGEHHRDCHDPGDALQDRVAADAAPAPDDVYEATDEEFFIEDELMNEDAGSGDGEAETNETPEDAAPTEPND